MIEMENLVINSLTVFLYPSYWYKIYMRRKIQKEVKLGRGEKYNQKEANQYFEGSNFEVQDVASVNFLSFSLGLFFSPITPLGLLLGLAELLITYLILKWYFVKQCKVPRDLSFEYCEKLMSLFELSLIIWAAGYVVFDCVTLKEVQLLTIVMAALAVVQYTLLSCQFVVFSRKTVIKNLNRKKFEELTFTFEYD